MKPYHYYSTTLQLVYKKKPVSKSERRYTAGICNGKKKYLYGCTYGIKYNNDEEKKRRWKE